MSRITVANTWTAADTYTLTIDNVDFILTIGTLVTTTQVAVTIFQALTGATFTDTTASCTIPVADGGAALIPQFSEFTATNNTATLVDLTANGTGALAGKPFTITVTGDGTASTGTAAISSITVATSQYHADQIDNYSGNALPTGGSDTLIFDNGNVDVRWGLDYATTLTAITKYKSYTGNVGLPEVNIDNASKPYHEYRTPTYLTCTACTTANLEVGEGPGSSRFKLNTGSGLSAINIFGRGSRIETGVPCILWKGTHASNTVSNLAGDVGIAFFGGEVATVLTLITGDGPSSSANTFCSTGCTLTTVTLNGGTQETNSAMTTANQNAGFWVHKAGTVTTANIYGGLHYPNGAATYTTLNLYGTFDASKGNAPFVITNTVQMYRGAKFIDPQGRAGNVVIKLNGCTFADVTIVSPFNKTITYS